MRLADINSTDSDYLIEIKEFFNYVCSLYNGPVSYQVYLPKRINYTKSGLYDVDGYGADLDFGICFDMNHKYPHLNSVDMSFVSPEALDKNWDKTVKCYLYVSDKENFDRLPDNTIMVEIPNVYSSLLDFCENHRSEMVKFILGIIKDLDRKIERSRPITLTLGELEDLIDRKIKESLQDLSLKSEEYWDYNYGERVNYTILSLHHGEDFICSETIN